MKRGRDFVFHEWDMRVPKSRLRRIFPEDVEIVDLGGKMDPYTLARVLTELLSHASLESLSMIRCGVDDDAMHVIAAIVNSTPTNFLRLSDKELTSKGVEALLDGLRGNMLLKELSLEAIPISNCVRALTRYMHADFSCLTHLCLNACGLSHADLCLIAEAMAHPGCTVEHLYLSGNRVNDGVVHALCAMLRTNTCLDELVLEECGVTEEHRRRLLAVPRPKRLSLVSY